MEQGSAYQGDDWWRWWVWIEGTDAELDDIDHVVYTLHPTFPQPVRTVRDRRRKFQLETAGWGTFVVYAAAVHGSGETTHLELMLDFARPNGDTAPERGAG